MKVTDLDALRRIARLVLRARSETPRPGDRGASVSFSGGEEVRGGG